MYVRTYLHVHANYSLISFLHSLWQTVSIEGTDIHSSDITVPRFFNISLFSTLQTSCNGDHVCYTEDFSSFYSLGKLIPSDEFRI